MAISGRYKPGASKDKRLQGNERVWEASEKDAARVLQSWCDNIEAAQWDQRFTTMTYYRYLLGRPAYYGYNLSAVARSASVDRYKRATWTAPTKNIIAQCYRTLDARIFKNRPALMVVPDAGDYDQQFAAEEQTRYLDAAFADGMWPLVEEATQDGSCVGSGFVLVDVDHDGECIRKRVIKQDEIIIDPAEGATNSVKQLAIRSFVDKYELLEQFGDDPDAVAAINAAPKAELGFNWDTGFNTDMVVLREYWKWSDDGKTGCHILATKDYCFKWEQKPLKRAPLAKFTFHNLGYFGKGGVEDSLGLQKEHNRFSMAMWENARRMAWPRWFIPAGQGINEGELSDTSAGFVHYKDKPPESQVGKFAEQEQFEYLSNLERGIKEMWRVSDQAAAGLPLPGANSGRARIVQDQLDDRAHAPLLLHLEDFVTDLGYLLVAAAEKVKPTYTLRGRTAQQLKYISFGDNPCIRAFPESNIPQSIAGRQDWIDRAFGQGRIDKDTKTRLEGLPDINGEVDLLTASEDSVRKACYDMLKTGKYIPPTGFGSLPKQLEYVQSKVLLEQNKPTPPPQKKLSLLYRYAAALADLIGEATPQPSAPGFGVSPPAGAPAAATGEPATPGLPQQPNPHVAL